jgi:hypothetical protein
MSFNQKLRQLLESTQTQELTKGESKVVSLCAEYFGQLDDHVLVEVTRFAMCACAFRLAVDRDEVDINPTEEVFKQALNDTIKLLQKSVDNDF